MLQPPGFEQGSHLVYWLHKALYGLKQAPRAWYQRLAATLVRHGFIFSKSDPSLFLKITPADITYVLHDFVITGSSSKFFSQLKLQLHAEFALKDMGLLHYFLGVEVKRLPNGSLHCSQHKYIQDLLHKVGMTNLKSISTPMSPNSKLSKFTVFAQKFHDPTFYRTVVGTLQYITITHPEVTYAVNKVCQYMSEPLEAYWTATKRILRYLTGTSDYGLVIQKSRDFSIRSFSDADWGSDVDDRRSVRR